MIYKDDRFKILHQGIDTLVIGVNCIDEKFFNTTFSSFIRKIATLKQQAQNLRTFGEKYILDDFAEALSDVATIDKPSKAEGRSLVMFLSAKKA